MIIKQGNLVQVWAPSLVEQSRLHGHSAIVLGTDVVWVNDRGYIRVLCDGPRMMPIGWLREIP